MNKIPLQIEKSVFDKLAVFLRSKIDEFYTLEKFEQMNLSERHEAIKYILQREKEKMDALNIQL